MPPQIPTYLKVGEWLRTVKRSGINDIFDLLRRAAVSRFKFAVPIVADMLNKRYRRRQFDSADSEFGDLEKTEYKGNPLLSGGGFQFVEKPLVYRKWGVERCLLCWFCIVQNFWQATKASLLWGIAPVQVVSHLCHCIVQWLCVADCKHPCLD